MAASSEIIRYVYEVTGNKDLADAARVLTDVGEVSEETAAAIRKLADEFAASEKASGAAKAYAGITDEQKRLADQTDALGLKLKLATQDEQALRVELEARKKAVADAVAAQDAYRASEERTAAGARQHADAVRAAKQAHSEINRELDASEAFLADTARQYNAVSDAQTRNKRELDSLASSLKAAGHDTSDLAAAQQDLQSRADASADQLRKLAAGSAEAAAAAERLAQAERRTLDALGESISRQRAAERASEQLAQAKAAIADRNASLNASEQRVNQTLGVSASKIAALGAAALGITSALDLARKGMADLVEQAGKLQTLDIQLDRKFGDDADKARAKLQEFRAVLPGVEDAFFKLKSFGIDPLNGSFDAIVNKAADLGGSMETVQGITLALGQAWAKEKLQGEEILQLVERGVPVWDLLAKATGKNVQELQKLSSSGKLGKDVIKALIDEIGRSADGAASALGGTLPAQINRLKVQYEDFLRSVAESGALELFLDHLQEIGAEIQRMSESGELQAWARSVAEAITSAASAIGGTVRFLIDHKEAIIALAGAYTASKAASLVGGLAAQVGELAKQSASGAVSLKSLVGSAGLVATAVTYTAGNLADLVEVLGQLQDVNRELARIEADAAGVREQNLATAAKLRAELGAYAQQAIRTGEELTALSDIDQQRYADSLVAAQRYWQAVKIEARSSGDAAREALATDRISRYSEALDVAGRTFTELARVAKQASRDLAMEAAGEALERLYKLREEGYSTAAALEQVGKSIDWKIPEAPRQVAIMLRTLAVEGEATASTVSGVLVESLARLDAQTLGSFQAGAVKALQDGKISADNLASVLDVTLQAALQRLGVNANQAGAGVTAAGRDMIDTFRIVASNAQATGEQIETAFRQAVSAAATRAELDALGDALEAAGSRGALSASQTERAMAALAARVRELAAEANPLADAFARLGIQSQQSLDAARDSAVEAFRAIVAGAKEGLASQEDVRRAWEAQARAQLDAVASAEPWRRAQVEANLEAQAAVYGTSDALQQLGLVGEQAGQQVAAGMAAAERATVSAGEQARIARLEYGELLYEANKGNAAAKELLDLIRGGGGGDTVAGGAVQQYTAAIAGANRENVLAVASLKELEIASASYRAELLALTTGIVQNEAEAATQNTRIEAYRQKLVELKYDHAELEKALTRVNEQYADAAPEVLLRRLTANDQAVKSTLASLDRQRNAYQNLSEEIRGPYVAAIDTAITKVKAQEEAAKTILAARRNTVQADISAAEVAHKVADAREREATAAERVVATAGSNTGPSGTSTIRIEHHLTVNGGKSAVSTLDLSQLSNAEMDALARMLGPAIVPHVLRELERSMRNAGY